MRRWSAVAAVLALSLTSVGCGWSAGAELGPSGTGRSGASASASGSASPSGDPEPSASENSPLEGEFDSAEGEPSPSGEEDTGTPDSEDSPEDPGAPHGQWSGKARISVTVSEPGCGTSEESYELPSTLIIDKPTKGEGNPFHLSWASDDQTATGAFGVTSALRGTDTRDGRQVQMDYWSLSGDGSGGFSGDLVDPGSAQGLTLNLLFLPKPLLNCGMSTPFVYGMGRGTELRGSVDGGSVSLTLTGTSQDGTRRFTVTW